MIYVKKDSQVLDESLLETIATRPVKELEQMLVSEGKASWEKTKEFPVVFNTTIETIEYLDRYVNNKTSAKMISLAEKHHGSMKRIGLNTYVLDVERSRLTVTAGPTAFTIKAEGAFLEPRVLEVMAEVLTPEK